MSDYKLFKSADMEASKSSVPETLVLKGGSIESEGGLLVDGKCSDVTVESKDNSPIYISSLAKLTNCVIRGKDMLIEGHVTGSIYATGKVEFAAGCVVVGTFYKGDEVYIHKLADLDDLIHKRSLADTKSGNDAGVKAPYHANGSSALVALPQAAAGR